MAETSSGTISSTEKLYNELSKMRCEGLFCRRCSCYCATKDEFNEHVQEHLKETNSGKENFMSYIENYICSKCGQQFEVKSDLIIHYNTVCTDALHICKHCRENCENAPFLQMHLVVHHNYSEEMLRDEGFLTDLDDNHFLHRCSFMTSFKCKAFQSPPTKVDNDSDNVGSSTLGKASDSQKYCKSRKNASTCQNLAFNLLDKSHTCNICNESFSRKCVLEIHAQKHTFKGTSEKKVNRNVLENNCTFTRNTLQNRKNIPSEATGLHSIGQRSILKPSNVVLRSSSIWKKVKPKRKFQSVKNYVPNRTVTRKNKKTEISKATTQNAHKTNISQLSKEIAVPVAWKKVKLKSKMPNALASDEQNHSKNLNKTKKSKSSETTKCKKTPKSEGKQDFTCELCKKTFKDGYKLRRHSLIHTGARPYTCTKCKKTFARDDHLKRHIKKVCSKAANSDLKK